MSNTISSLFQLFNPPQVLGECVGVSADHKDTVHGLYVEVPDEEDIVQPYVFTLRSFRKRECTRTVVLPYSRKFKFSCLCCDSVGKVYVCDAGTSVVLCIDSTGGISTLIGPRQKSAKGYTPRAVRKPFACCCDSRNKLYVLDCDGLHRITIDDTVDRGSAPDAHFEFFPLFVYCSVGDGGLCCDSADYVYCCAGDGLICFDAVTGRFTNIDVNRVEVDRSARSLARLGRPQSAFAPSVSRDGFEMKSAQPQSLGALSLSAVAFHRPTGNVFFLNGCSASILLPSATPPLTDQYRRARLIDDPMSESNVAPLLQLPVELVLLIDAYYVDKRSLVTIPQQLDWSIVGLAATIDELTVVEKYTGRTRVVSIELLYSWVI